VEHAAILARGDFGVGLRRLAQGALFGQGDDAVEQGIIFFQPLDVKERQPGRGDLAGAQEFGQLGDGEPGEIGGLGRLCQPRGADDAAELLPGRENESLRDRVEEQSRDDAVGQRKGADRFEMGELTLEAFEHGVAFGRGEGEALKPFRLGHHPDSNRIPRRRRVSQSSAGGEQEQYCSITSFHRPPHKVVRIIMPPNLKMHRAEAKRRKAPLPP